LTTVAQQLKLNKNQLNQVDNGGTHGERISSAFAAAAQAASTSGSNDAGQQLQAAAQAMRQQGGGKSATFYAQGLEQAAQQFTGKSGISAADLGPFLQSFLGGVQKNNPAQPGQGTMLDALGPAVTAFTQGQQSGNTQQAITNSLGAAIKGATSTGNGGTVDPGAASITNVLGGIFSAVAPQLINDFMRGGQNQTTVQGQGQGQSGGFNLGGLVGDLMGGSQAQQSGQSSWVNGLLGGLVSTSGSQAGGQNMGSELGGLMGDLMGGQSQG
jgi:dihydroxyacetone kinase-like protein